MPAWRISRGACGTDRGAPASIPAVLRNPDITTTDTAIHTNGFRDLYTVLGDERDGQAVLRLYVNPLAPWIWLGALVMAAGGVLSLVGRRLRISAPSRRRVAVLV